MRRLLLCAVVAAAALSAAVAGGLEAARAARAQGRFAEAAELYRDLLRAQPDDPDALRELAQVLAWDGRFDEALQAYDAALSVLPGDDTLLLGKARTLSWAPDYEASLAIYADYLESHPGDAAIRVEMAKVRSWSGDYDGAVSFYREHLETHPGDVEVRRELAKVLSWGKRFDESVAEFRRLLDDQPEDREALLGLARVLSWDGRYDESMAVYRRLLALHPDDAEARVGLARTLAWSGDLAGAEAGYDAVLAGRPENAEALLGKAQLAFWRGEARRSERLLARAEAAAPDSRDAAALRAELRKTRRPRVDANYDRVLDTDGNDLEIYRASATFQVAPGVSLAGLYRHANAFLERPQFNACLSIVEQVYDRAGVDFLGARLGLGLPRGVGLQVTLGVDRAHPSVGEATARGAGSVVGFGPIRGTWRWRAALERRTFDATRVIVDCGVTFDAASGGVHGTWHRWRLAAGAGLTDFSDGNGRLHVDLSAIRPFEFWGQKLEAGYRFRYMTYDENLANGYFDPQSFTSHIATGRLSGRFFHPRLDYGVRVDLGLQSFEQDENTIVDAAGLARTLAATDSGSDTVFGWEVRLGWSVTDKARLEAYYGENDYAAQSATGFKSEHSGLLVRYRF